MIVRAARTAAARILLSRPAAAAIDAATGKRPASSGGLRVDLRHPHVTPRTRAAVQWRRYERDEIRLIRRWLPSDTDVVELGAGLGVTGAHILDRIDPNRRLVAVELDPASVDVLNTTLADPRAEVVNAAIDYSGIEVAADISSSVLHSRVGAGSGPRVTGLTLAGLLDTRRIGEYALVCDIEGAEADLAVHDAAALDRCRLIIVETHGYHDQTLTREGTLAALTGLGFTVAASEGRSYALAR